MPDIEGGDTVEQARRGGEKTAVHVAVDALLDVLSGDGARDLQEVRQHMAFLESILPASQRMAIIGEFGRLLDPDPPHLAIVPDDPGGAPPL